MARIQTRHSVSVSRRVFEALKTHCEQIDMPIAQLIERLICAELAIERPANPASPLAVVVSRAQIDDVANAIALRDRVLAAPGPRLTPPRLEVSDGLASMLDDECERRREMRGEKATPSEVLDAAINRTLDAIEAGTAPLSLEEVI